MSKPKGIARAAKERRRTEAEDRNARTPSSRRRVTREGGVDERRKRTVVSMWSPSRKPEPIPREYILGGESGEWTLTVIRKPAGDRPATIEHLSLGQPQPAPAAPRVPGQPTTPRTKRVPRARRRPSVPTAHVAARRIGDGLKPNHTARVVDIEQVYPRTSALDALVQQAMAEGLARP